MKNSAHKCIRDRWSWTGFIPTSHTSASGTSCLSYQRRTDEILGRKIGLPKIGKSQREKVLGILTGICLAIALWVGILLAYEFWTMVGGH